MTTDDQSFPVGVDFSRILSTISKQIYETSLAFIRENVQNAVDAIRMQAYREGTDPGDSRYRIDVTVQGNTISVRDNGIGMTHDELKKCFWTMGASGKQTAEAQAAGCVGTFGIGGFANFGVCDTLEVTSQTHGTGMGTRTWLSEQEIRSVGTVMPRVRHENSDSASPRGTLVVGQLKSSPDVDQLRAYLQDFVRYVPTAVFFDNRKISQTPFAQIESQENLTEIDQGIQVWNSGDLQISGRLYEDRGYILVVDIECLHIGGDAIRFTGRIRMENGLINVFKRGFKLCATQIGSAIGVTGRMDSDRFVPTAGRDSLDSDTMGLLTRIVQVLERVSVEKILESPARVAQHTRMFPYILQHGLINKLEQVLVTLADGSENTLGTLRTRAEKGGMSVFFGQTRNQALNQIMQTRGHTVVLLSGDRHRRDAEKRYLEQFCGAKPFDGMIDCAEYYHDDALSRFERIFLSELEFSILRSYDMVNIRLIPGRLTEDIPVFVKDHSASRVQPLEIIVDVRHPEVTKLSNLGNDQVLYALITSFCREYLGQSLKKWSPRYFGNGALNLELLAKRLSEYWTLIKDDIGMVHRGGHRQVVRHSDVQVVHVGQTGDGNGQNQPQPSTSPSRILHILDKEGTTELNGYYIRLLDTSFKAYGDLLPQYNSIGVSWAGNKITYVVSDVESIAYHYEIKLDKVVVIDSNGTNRAEGAIALDVSLQPMYEGIYFKIPEQLKRFLVPQGEEEIRLQLDFNAFGVYSAGH